jgi:MoaA/NifB/PqqE/SkfB family radical SAM enzyme
MINSKEVFEEVFYHITMDCNLRCGHCYVGKHLQKNQHFDTDQIINDLSSFKEKGTKKIVLLGGEPTIHPEFMKIFTNTLKIGFVQVVVDTNGQIAFPIPDKYLDIIKIRFSFEGHNSDTNDRIRGNGTFNNSLDNLKIFYDQNVNCEITCTINQYNFKELSKFIDFFTNLGIKNFNFHFLSLTGTAQNNQHLLLRPEEVLEVQELLQTLSEKNNILMRYPNLIVHEDNIPSEINRGLHCLIGSHKRLLVFPYGQNIFCPLELSNTAKSFKDKSGISICPYEELLFPDGLPPKYKMTCISWK